MFLRSVTASAVAALMFAVATPAAAWVQSATSQPEAAAQPITKSALTAQLEGSFNRLDTNKDKSLSKAEIEAAQARNLASAKAELDKRISAEFSRLDSDKSGQLSLAEFKAGAPEAKSQPSDGLLKQLDRNSDGKVALDEFRATPLANFDRIDLNKDGNISADERTAAQRRK